MLGMIGGGIKMKTKDVLRNHKKRAEKHNEMAKRFGFVKKTHKPLRCTCRDCQNARYVLENHRMVLEEQNEN